MLYTGKKYIHSLYNLHTNSYSVTVINIVKLRQGSGKDQQGMAVKAKGLKA